MKPTWKGGRTEVGVEYFHYPSLHAQNLWNTVLSIGRSRTPHGFRHLQNERDGYLLHYMRKGEMWHRIVRETRRVGPGKVCLMDLQQRAEYGNDRPAAAENWWLLFHGKDMPALFTEMRADSDPVFPLANVRLFEERFETLVRLTDASPVNYEIESASLLLGLLSCCFTRRAERDDQPALVESGEVLSLPVRRAVDYMTRLYHQPIRLQNLADFAARSPSSFLRQFHKEVGVTPKIYLSRYRMERAKRLLINNDKSIGEIGAMVGVPRANYFTRLFTKIVGVPPTDWRRQQRNARKRRR